MIKLIIVLCILAGISFLVYAYKDKLEEWFPGIKTKVWNGFITVMGIVGTALSFLQENAGTFGSFMTPQNAGLAFLSIGIIGILLRSVTK